MKASFQSGPYGLYFYDFITNKETVVILIEKKKKGEKKEIKI